MRFEPDVWGPHYWFFLHTIALTYPHRPNDITKKKFYEFIQNLPLFMPIEETASEFVKCTADVRFYLLEIIIIFQIDQKCSKRRDSS